MAAISSLGVGSGLDSEGIISALLAVERRPIDLLKQRTTDTNTQLSSIGKLQSLTSTMTDKANALSSVTLWGQKTFASGDATSITGSATSAAVAGRYSVTVGQLASSQTVTSNAFASSSATLNEGSLTIELGAWDGPPATQFSPKSGATPTTITIGAGETSLSKIRDKINAASAGVTATIVNDATGARLSLRSTATGEENGFRISAAETTDDGDATTGLSALAYSPLTASTTMTLNQWSNNAKAMVNGIQVESKTNTFDGVADGLSFTVAKASATPVELTITADNSAVKTGIEDFVKAFNELATFIKDQTKYDAASKKGGVLQGDQATIGFQWQLRGMLNQNSSASSTWSRLSEIGIAMKADGTLGTDATKLSDALAKPDELRKLLATDGSTTANSGFMDRFRDLGKRVLDVDGSLQQREDALNEQVKRNNDRQAQMETRITSVEARLRAQYQTLDTNMSKLSNLSSYVSQQLSLL